MSSRQKKSLSQVLGFPVLFIAVMAAYVLIANMTKANSDAEGTPLKVHQHAIERGFDLGPQPTLIQGLHSFEGYKTAGFVSLF